MSALHELVVRTEVAHDLPAPGVIRIQLSNRHQGRHLFQSLRGHCEVELIPGSDEAGLAITNTPNSGTKALLRRIDAWLREFGVESVTIELNGHEHVMRRAAS